ncbi:MAG: cell division protein FtsL [bacterium]|nr:cell division protein FtsL [bacterium]
MLPSRQYAPVFPAKPSLPPARKNSHKLKVKRKAIIGIAFGLFVIMCLALATVARQSQIVTLDKNISKLQLEVKNLTEQNQTNLVSVNQLSSSARIDRIAREKLGMSKPKESQIVRVGILGGGN